MKAKNIQEYLGSLQQTVVTSWRKHLKSSKHSEHVILNDFYDDMLDAVDELTEAYMAENGKIEGYINLFKDTKKLSAYDYVKMIHDFIDENRELVGDKSELQSLVDDVLGVCNTALYKLKELVGESTMINLVDFIKESLEINEARLSKDAKYVIKNTLKLLKDTDSSYTNWEKIKVDSTKDNKWIVYYDGEEVGTYDIFPVHEFDADSIYNIITELNWLKK